MSNSHLQLPEEIRAKITSSVILATKGIKKTAATKERMSKAQKKRFSSFEEREKHRKAQPNWKGTLPSWRYRFRKSLEYIKWRDDVFKRDNYTCQISGVRGGILEAHHIVPLHEIIEKYDIKTLEDAMKCEDFWDVSNGKTLSKKEHKKLHSR